MKKIILVSIVCVGIVLVGFIFWQWRQENGIFFWSPIDKTVVNSDNQISNQSSTLSGVITKTPPSFTGGKNLKTDIPAPAPSINE